MKKNLFNKSVKLIMGALLLAFGIISCQKNAATTVLPSIGSDNSSSKGGSPQAGKPNTLPQVSLNLVVGDAAGDKIISDGGGVYKSGSQGVSAVFDQYGNFIFSCGPASVHGMPIRYLNFNFSDPVVVYIAPPITSGNNIADGISTIAVSPSGTFIPLQSLAITQSECIGLTGGPNYYNHPAWVLNYHRGAEDVTTSPSAYMVVTRINSTQWTMTPVGSCSPHSNVAALRNGPGTLYGYYTMPFSFTLTAQ